MSHQPSIMNLNRNNYEAFFLLYVDNELSAADRNAVELFVQENADLKEELNMLQQTVFKADAVVFDNKASLLKEGLTALQENLLLYIDDELNTADKLNVEKLLIADTAANKELLLLQQTKLQSDNSIVFADKKLLYRKENAKVVGLPWRRIAVAAVLLGIGTWATVLLINTDKTAIGNAVTNADVKTTAPKQQVNTAENSLQTTEKNAAVKATTVSTQAAIKPVSQKNNMPGNNVQNNLATQKEINTIAVQQNKKPDNNLPKPVYDYINNNSSNKNNIATVPVINEATVNLNSGVNTAVTASNKKTNNEVTNTYALNTNFTEGDAEENNNNKILYMDEDKVKKTKIGGFFRKVKRMVERSTNVTTGNSIKLAGFDIAIK
jgi:anti-sigma factor RsiW